MEQRISTDTPAVHPAGTDPAFVPGLTPPPQPGPPEASRSDDEAADDASGAAERTEQGREDEEATARDAAADGSDAAADAGEETDEKADEGADEKAGETAEEGEEPADGPVFTAFDLRGSITAKRSGITLDMDGEEAQFDWEEIGAVQIDTSRLRRRLTVTVHTTGHVAYEAELKAPSRRDLATWESELDAVLDAYFDGDDDGDA